MLVVSTLSADSCCATKVLYVSMSVSVQCLCADVEGNDVPTIWCIRLSMVVLSAVCQRNAGVKVKSTTVSKECTYS